jgi:hypothetical protein
MFFYIIFFLEINTSYFTEIFKWAFLGTKSLPTIDEDEILLFVAKKLRLFSKKFRDKKLSII